jgi:hypothetical protein
VPHTHTNPADDDGQGEPKPRHNAYDADIGKMFRSVGAVAGVIGVVVAAVWQVAAINTRITGVEILQAGQRSEIARVEAAGAVEAKRVDESSLLRHNTQEAEITKIDAAMTVQRREMEQSTADLRKDMADQRKDMAVMLEILKRLDKQDGGGRPQ